MSERLLVSEHASSLAPQRPRRQNELPGFGTDDPRSLESLHGGLACLDALRSVDLPYLDRLPWSGRMSMRMVSRIPAPRDAGRLLRYRF